MLKIGCRCHDYGRGEPIDIFSRVRADGFECIQLAIKKTVAQVESHEQITPSVLEQIKTALGKTGLSVGVLGCYVEPSLSDEGRRKAAVKEFCDSISFAKVLQAGCIGTETTPMSLQPGISRKEALQNLLRSLGEILPIAQQEGVLVAIEPVFTHAMNTPEQARWVLDQMASPNLGIIFDPVNVLNVQEIDSQRQLWERCFECFGDRIAAVHMKGADLCDGEIVPVPYTDSALDYPYLFQQLKALGKDLPILREEVDPAHAREDVAFLRSFL